MILSGCPSGQVTREIRSFFRAPKNDSAIVPADAGTPGWPTEPELFQCPRELGGACSSIRGRSGIPRRRQVSFRAELWVARDVRKVW